MIRRTLIAAAVAGLFVLTDAASQPAAPQAPDITGAKERHQTARLGDARIELMAIQQVEHTTIPLL